MTLGNFIGQKDRTMLYLSVHLSLLNSIEFKSSTPASSSFLQVLYFGKCLSLKLVLDCEVIKQIFVLVFHISQLNVRKESSIKSDSR